jgi:type I restriction enzyme R subunit
MGDLAPLARDNIISMVDKCHRSQKGDGTESYAMTMRVKLANGFRFGFTGTPIDKTMQSTHRDFGPLKDGVQVLPVAQSFDRNANRGSKSPLRGIQ